MTIIVLVIYFECAEDGVGQVGSKKRLLAGWTLHCEGNTSLIRRAKALLRRK